MYKSLEDRWVQAGLALSFSLMGAMNFFSYQNAIFLRESSKQIWQTNNALQSLNEICATLTEAESGRLRYVLFQTSMSLEKYQTAVNALSFQLVQLERNLASNSPQSQQISTLKKLVSTHIALLEGSIATRKVQSSYTDSTAFLIQIEQSHNAIQQIITKSRKIEEELLKAQVQQAQSNLQVRMLIEVLGTLSTFVVLSWVYISLYQQMAKRQLAEVEQQKLVQQKELSEMKVQFFSMVSHEFRTPLSLILGSTQLLVKSLKPLLDPVGLKNLRRIYVSAKVMSQQLSDILTLARADAGQLEFSPKRVEIQTFCLNLIEDIQLFSEFPRSINFTKQSGNTHVWVDEKLLYSILSNLFSNAIKYSPPNSTIYFTYKVEPESLTFQIRDEGIGIAEEEQQKIYEPFTRGINAKDILGTGLGLAIVKKCLDVHRGKISVESRICSGSTFTVHIPQPIDEKPH